MKLADNKHCNVFLTRRVVIGAALSTFGAPASLHAQSVAGLPAADIALSRGEWPAYAGTNAAARYSPLTQIDRSNAGSLRIAWRWTSPDQAVKASNPHVGPTRANESTPVMVGGSLYTSTSLSQVAAIN